MEILYLVIAFAVHVFLAFVAKNVAIEKGRDGTHFFVLSLLIGFLVAILVLIALPALPLKPNAPPSMFAGNPAKVIVGNPAKVISTRPDVIAESNLNSLNRVQYQQWEVAGKPDLSGWRGSDFDAWIAQHSSAEAST